MNVEELKKILDYDQGTGVFTWKEFRGGSAKAGSVAGSIDSKGYVQIKIGRRLHLAHRLAWLWVHGVLPDSHLDHIDRNPGNNAICNLRPCTRNENHQNLGIRANNTSGTTGVSWVARSQKWLAYINAGGVRKRLGLFDSKSDAIEARLKGKVELHRFHPTQPVGAQHGVQFKAWEGEQ